MAKPLQVGERSFATKTAAQDFYRSILHRYKYGERVTAADEDELKPLFLRHPEADQKLAGQPISHFEVRSNRYGTKSFFVIRADSSFDDFSLFSCI
jgi:Protein of unknown function (DUF3223)